MSLRSCKILIVASLLLLVVNGWAQSNDSTSEFKISGYTDVYYARYTDSVGLGNYQKFPVVSPRNNQIGLNIVQLTGQYTSANVRAIVTLHYGDMPASAWSPQFNMIQEANAGVKLAKKLWLDAGFFKTHIGTEALLPKDNIASSLSIITVYEPWYQSGVKLTYLPNDKFLFCLHILNGYNTFVSINNKKAAGVSFLYTMNDKFSFGYYNLLSDNTPDSIKTSHVRFLNNFVFNYQISPKIKVVAGADYIGQQHSGLIDPNKYASVYSLIVTMKYQFVTKFGVYGRYELFDDNDGILSGATNRYDPNGVTLGAEYKPTGNSYIRLEGRELIMDDSQKIFRTDGQNTNTRYEAMINLGVWF